VAAWLGWMFDGLDMHLYTLVAAPFVMQLLGAVSTADPLVKEKSSWIQAAFLIGWALGGGLFVMAVSCAGLMWVSSVPMTAVLLFGLGVGWNLSFVSATAQLVDATRPAERGKVLGLNDLLAGLTGAGLALAGGVALDVLGVAALALGATVLAVAPAIFLSRLKPAAQTAA